MTDFSYSEEDLSFRELALRFAEDQIAPYASQWDREHTFPLETLREAARLGFAALYVSPERGGVGASRLQAAMVFEALSEACVSTAAFLSIHNMVAWLIHTYGSESQCQRFFPSLSQMDRVASYALTEPDAGSDAASLKTQALSEGDAYRVSGSKAFISGGGRSDLYAVMVRTGGAGSSGISCLLIEKEMEGLSFGKFEDKLGWHSQPTAMLFFDKVSVPHTMRLGAEGAGFKMALTALNGGRVNIAACSLGGARACLKAAQQYLRSRKQFGRPLSDFQVLQFRMADLWTELEAARLLVHRAAWALDAGHPETVPYCAMAKRYATDVGFHVADAVLQMFGGYGYLCDYPIERYFRDLRVHSILEGTNEIMRLILARRLLQEQGAEIF